MLKGLEKAKAIREFRSLRESIDAGGLKGLEKARSLKRLRELRVLLGGDGTVDPVVPPIAPEPQPEPATNPLYQSVLDGAAVTIDLVKQVRAEGQKDPDHPQLRPAVRVIHSATKAMAA